MIWNFGGKMDNLLINSEANEQSKIIYKADRINLLSA